MSENNSLPFSENIHAVVLAGSRDFGRCPVTSRMPMALWPVGGTTVLEHLLGQLAGQGIARTTICYYSDDEIIEKTIAIPQGMDVRFIKEVMPLGSAGCLRLAWSNTNSDSVMMVLPAHLISLPDIQPLLDQHRRLHSQMTMVLNPETEHPTANELTGIYFLTPQTVTCIPSDGYYDIKESLIGLLLKQGEVIHTIRLDQPAGNFNNWIGYVDAVCGHVERQCTKPDSLPENTSDDCAVISAPSTAKIDSTARLLGPVCIQENVTVSEHTVIIGPTMIGRAVTIGPDCLVANSVIWDNVEIQKGCKIEESMIDSGMIVPGGSTVRGQLMTKGKFDFIKYRVGRVKNSCRRAGDWILQDHHKAGDSSTMTMHAKEGILGWISVRQMMIMVVVLMAAVMWSYWSTITDLWQQWMRSDEYSSGLLVPFLAVYIIGMRRRNIAEVPVSPSLWWGMGLFIVALGLRLLSMYFLYASADRISLVITIWAIVYMLLGRHVFIKLLPIGLFLFLMLPLPNRIQVEMALPLQNWATSSAVFLLETVGYNVIREGNVIRIDNVTVAVAEACNGLRMITAFFVISGMVILLINKEWWEKLILLITTLPVALLCNTIRLTLTTIAFTWLSGPRWEKIFHDFGGYAMMPLALAIILGELWILRKAIPAVDRTENG